MSSPKPPPGPNVSDKDVQALLQRLRCPMPLHALRTLLLGNIASPRMDVSPMAPLAQAWGGEMPEFASAAEVEEVMQVIVHGLWNRLSEHQNSRTPFRLPRFEVAPTRTALLDLARMRGQELKGFVDGLFGTEDEMLLPQKAHEAVTALADVHAMFDGAVGLLSDDSKPAPEQELKALLRNFQQMTIVADEQINKAAPLKDGKPTYKLSVNDLVIKAYALALRAVPDANVSWTDGAMLKHKHADVGVAVSIPGGLITPVIRDACHKSLSAISNEMKDLAARFPWIDIDRAAMWGHSGGGFITADAMFRHPDFFKVGIAESGNHDQRVYEDDWGERYQGLLRKGDKGAPDSYAAEANQTVAKNLKGKLLLIHGMMDDNVPPQNTYLVMEALIKANKDFDLLLLPGQRHGYGADGAYVMRRRWDYFVRHLLGAEPPKEYRMKPQGAPMRPPAS